MKFFYLFIVALFLAAQCVTANGAERGVRMHMENTGVDIAGTCSKEPMGNDAIIRLAKIEVFPEYLDEYRKMAAEVGEISLRTEPGVLTMYPLAEKDNPCMITILETYSSPDAYKAHLATEHFKKYKEGTKKMVKSLLLTDQIPMNPRNRIANSIEE